MKRKRIRQRRRVFRRRRNAAAFDRALLWLLVIPVAVGGYFLAQFLFAREANAPTIAPTTPTVGTTTTAPTVPTSPPPAQEEGEESLRAVYLPSAVLREPTMWTQTLQAASGAGYNAVIVDVKDAEGLVWYASASPLAAAARSVQSRAISVEALAALRDTLQTEWGLALIPRVFAFCDHTAPRYLEAARVTVQGDPHTVWYDDKPDEGGRRWLNPYAEEAQQYILEIVAELQGLGFPMLILDGVQFPRQEARAYYGDATQTALARGDVLANFVSAVDKTLGKGGWMLAADGMAAVGEKTAVYGANPATFGAAAVAPWSLPSSLGSKLELGGETVLAPREHPYETATLLFQQLKTRLQLMERAPRVVPWLQAEGYPTEAVAAQVTALREQFGADAGYILYHPEGKYVF